MRYPIPNVKLFIIISIAPSIQVLLEVHVHSYYDMNRRTLTVAEIVCCTMLLSIYSTMSFIYLVTGFVYQGTELLVGINYGLGRMLCYCGVVFH